MAGAEGDEGGDVGGDAFGGDFGEHLGEFRVGGLGLEGRAHACYGPGGVFALCPWLWGSVDAAREVLP